MTKKFKKYIRVAAGTPFIKVADPLHNSQEILHLMRKAENEDVQLLVLPELCITGYTCGDLFLQDTLLSAAEDALNFLAKESKNTLVVLGLPMRQNGKLYNMAAIIYRGEILACVPKSANCNDLRYFTSKDENILFQCDDFTFAIEADIDATIIVNLSASHEAVGKAAQRRALATVESHTCGYVYANAGHGESTGDAVFSGHNLIYEMGELLSESSPFGEGWAVSEIDISAIDFEQQRINKTLGEANIVPFSMKAACETLTRPISPNPFMPQNEKTARCEEILNIQAAGLEKRMEHTNSKKVVIGVSGGLDSTLALLAIARVTNEIEAITMPCFGTTIRTKRNAHALCEALGIFCREIDITHSVTQHLNDIAHTSKTDIVYENAQARMRTYVLMDIANQVDGLVIGTGSLSELALGWATYNGDHMSMYALNASIPKTTVRHIVGYMADNANPALSAVLSDILDTPVSPELLPNQITEELVGPYELHDFFIYYMLKHGKSPKQIYHLACLAFDKNPEVILKWLKVFYNRFFAQQYKRNCLPDGPKVGFVSLSPRGDWRMPSDASSAVWMRELEGLEI